MWWMMESCLTSLPSNTSWKRANFRVTWSLSRDFSTVCMHAFRCFEYIIQEDLWLYSKAFIYLFAHDMFNSKVLKAFANIKWSVNPLHVSIKQWKKSFIIKHYELDLKNIPGDIIQALHRGCPSIPPGNWIPLTDIIRPYLLNLLCQNLLEVSSFTYF